MYQKNILVIVIFLLPRLALALQLTPSSYELEPEGSLTSHVFQVVNDTNDIIAVQASVHSRKWVENKELNSPAAEFELFPSKLILKPKEKKGIRVRWQGEKKLKKEQAYRLVIEQLPVNFTKAQKNSTVKVLHKVLGALYVTPPNSKPDLSFDNVKKTHETEKGSMLVFDVTNNGNRHTLLNKHKISVIGNSKVDLTPDAFNQLNTQNVLPGSTLTVTLPWPNALGDTTPSIVEQ